MYVFSWNAQGGLYNESEGTMSKLNILLQQVDKIRGTNPAIIFVAEAGAEGHSIEVENSYNGYTCLQMAKDPFAKVQRCRCG